MLPVDARVAMEWGELNAAARRTGGEPPAVDGMLLATARAHDLVLVTRNERDCTGHGVDVLNPWS